jgi:predicted RNA binding protein with dsRBD fold (UPF0201 family)
MFREIFMESDNSNFNKLLQNTNAIRSKVKYGEQEEKIEKRMKKFLPNETIEARMLTNILTDNKYTNSDVKKKLKETINRLSKEYSEPENDIIDFINTEFENIIKRTKILKV